MAKQWYYHDGKQGIGPVTVGQLKKLAQEGAISAETPVRPEDRKQWVKAQRVKGLVPANSAPAVEPTDTQAHGTSQLPPPVPVVVAKPREKRKAATEKTRTRDSSSTKYIVFAIAGVAALAVIGIASLFLFRGDSANEVEIATTVDRSSDEVQRPAIAASTPAESPTPSDVSLAYEILWTYPNHAVDRGLSESPAENVETAKKLLKSHLSENPGASDRETVLAKRALRLIELANSEEKLIHLLVQIESFDPDEFEDMLEERSIDVPSEIMDAFGEGFFEKRTAPDDEKLFRVIERKGDGSMTRVGCSSREYSTMLEAVFFNNLYANAKVAKQESLRRKAADRAKRVAARPADPPVKFSIYEVDESIGKFDGTCVAFSAIWIYGDIEKQDDGFYVVGIEDERGETYRGSRSKMRFICTKELADVFRKEIDADIKTFGKVYCDLYEVPDKSTSTIYVNGKEMRKSSAVGEVYKIETIARDGSVLRTIQE